MNKTYWWTVIIRLAAVLLLGSIGVFIHTFLVSPVQENKSTVLPLKLPSSVPLSKLQLVAINFLKKEGESYEYKYSNN